MKQITTYIPFWQELLEHKPGFSDMEIHQNIAKLYVNAVMDNEKIISYEVGMDCCQKALEHIRKSFTASRESNENRRKYEESIMPEGNCLEVCGATPGDPNTKGLPTWEPYSENSGVTMILDNKCYPAKNHDRELLQYSRPIW